MQPTQLATRAQQHVDPGHAGHEFFGAFHGRSIDYRHLQGRARRGQLEPLARRCQHPVVADPLDAAGQHMQQEPSNGSNCSSNGMGCDIRATWDSRK